MYYEHEDEKAEKRKGVIAMIAFALVTIIIMIIGWKS